MQVKLVLSIWGLSLLVGAVATTLNSALRLGMEFPNLPGSFGLSLMYFILYSLILFLPLVSYSILRIHSALIGGVICVIFVIWALWVRVELLNSFANGDEGLSIGYVSMILSAVILTVAAKFHDRSK